MAFSVSVESVSPFSLSKFLFNAVGKPHLSVLCHYANLKLSVSRDVVNTLQFSSF